MRQIVLGPVLALVFLLGAGSGPAGSGLRGTVLLDPGYPVCKAGQPCTRPAKHVVLRFSSAGRVVAHVRTDRRGRYRIRLAPGRAYRVSTPITRATLRPQSVKVLSGTFRRVTFRLDTGIH